MLLHCLILALFSLQIVCGLFKMIFWSHAVMRWENAWCIRPGSVIVSNLCSTHFATCVALLHWLPGQLEHLRPQSMCMVSWLSYSKFASVSSIWLMLQIYNTLLAMLATYTTAQAAIMLIQLGSIYALKVLKSLSDSTEHVYHCLIIQD